MSTVSQANQGDDPIYLDYNGTTPLHPEVISDMVQMLQTKVSKHNPYLTQYFGNPSAANIYGIDAKMALSQARQQVADLLGCQTEHVIFTSGGTESNNIAIQSVVRAAVIKGIATPHIISSPYEHPSVVEVIKICKQLYGARETVLKCDRFGRVDVQQLKQNLNNNTAIVTVMFANNEFGTINDVQEIQKIIDEYNSQNNTNVILHSDYSQAVGKVHLKIESDLATIAGHKLYAPKGIGALIIRTNKVQINQIYGGASQESNIRPGTEPVHLARALGIACVAAKRDLNDRVLKSYQYIQILYNELKTTQHKVNGYLEELLQTNLIEQHFQNVIGGHEKAKCLPNTLSISFRDCIGGSLALKLSKQVCVAAGAACHADSQEASPSILALGTPATLALGTLRISVGEGLSSEAVQQAAQYIKEAVQVYQGQQQDNQTVKTTQQYQQLPDTPQHALNLASNIQHYNSTNQYTLNNATCEYDNKQIDLTMLTQGLGCACKLRPQLLHQVLSQLQMPTNQHVIVGAETADDAAILDFSIGSQDVANSQLVVLTTDFFPPPLPDAVNYGRVAAANALSDVYAMGGTPRAAICVAGFPAARMSAPVIMETMQGIIDVVGQSGAALVGGHTIDSVEPFLGLCCVGIVNKQNMKRNFIELQQLKMYNNNAYNDQVYLILTKKLCAGALSAALKRGILNKLANGQQIKQDLYNNVTTLNDGFLKLEQQLKERVIAMTDITGFGLVGHLAEMLSPAKLSAEIYRLQLPLLEGAEQIIKEFSQLLGNGTDNELYANQLGIKVQCSNNLSKQIICDPNTSGGLLMAVAGLDPARQISQQLNGQIVGRVYHNTQESEIRVLEQAFRPFNISYNAYFKE